MFEALINAGANIIGGMMGQSGQAATNAQQLNMFQQQMNFNSTEAQKNRDWQETMSNTAYTRAMADMRNAGLNPILAAGNGGASSPGGGQGSIGGTPTLGNPGAEMGRGVAAAGKVGLEARAIEQTRATTEREKTQSTLNEATEAMTKEAKHKVVQDTATSAAQMNAANASADNTKADTLNKGIQSLILSHDATTAFEKSRQAKFEADQSGRHGPGVWGNLLGTAEKTVGNVVDYFKSGQPQRDADTRRARRLENYGGSAPEGGLTIDMRK